MRSSATAFCTAWMKSWRLSRQLLHRHRRPRRRAARRRTCPRPAASAPRDRACAGRASARRRRCLRSVGITRTKNATTTSTRMRSLVKRLSLPERCTSSLRVFMFTQMSSWKTGSFTAPPSMTTFWPPRPVRTNERSFEERWYRREKIIPTTNSATTHDQRDDDAVFSRSGIVELPFVVCSALRYSRSGLGLRMASKRLPAHALHEQHLVARAERDLRIVRLDHDVERLAVLGGDLGLRRDSRASRCRRRPWRRGRRASRARRRTSGPSAARAPRRRPRPRTTGNAATNATGAPMKRRECRCRAASESRCSRRSR